MKRRLIFRVAGLALIIIFIGVTLGFTHVERKGLVLNSISVSFKEPYQFITDKEVEAIVLRNFKRLRGSLLDSVNTHEIELKIEEIAWVYNAEVYKGYALADTMNAAGRLNIKIEQEVPVLRVVNDNGSYYVNEHGKKMPASLHHTSNVIVVTGKVTYDRLTKILLPFVEHLSADDFWRSLFLQIDVQSNGELVLVPRVGNHRIVFGTTDNIDQKLRNLKLVYTKGFNGEDWKKYKTVSLKYNNQVVCTLR
jgi:cell division protein FtsQ